MITSQNLIYFNLKKIAAYIIKTVDSQNSLIANIKIIAFIVYMIVCILLYLSVWTPYINKLNVELMRTKSMVSIIPFEIIQQLSDVHKFILDHVLFGN